MKKLLIISTIALICASGCSHVDKVNGKKDVAISWQAVTGMKTKAHDGLVDNNIYPTDEQFGSFAFRHTGDFANEGDLYIDNASISYDLNGSDRFEANTWHSEALYYWPQDGTKLTFFAYSPVSVNAVCTAETGVSVAWYDVNAAQRTDFMVADVARDKTVNDSNSQTSYHNGVPTVFRHKLAQVTGFSIRSRYDYAPVYAATGAYGAGDKVFTLKSISIKDIRYEGAYAQNSHSPETEGWTPRETKKSYQFYRSLEGLEFNTSRKTIRHIEDNVDPAIVEPTIDNGYLLVLPQVFDNEARIEIVYTITSYANAEIKSTETVVASSRLTDIHSNIPEGVVGEWKMNYKYIYDMAISLEDNIIYWDPCVEEWEPETHVPIGL